MADKVIVTYPGAADREVFNTPDVVDRYLRRGWTVLDTAPSDSDAFLDAMPDPFAVADDTDQEDPEE